MIPTPFKHYKFYLIQFNLFYIRHKFLQPLASVVNFPNGRLSQWTASRSSQDPMELNWLELIQIMLELVFTAL